MTTPDPADRVLALATELQRDIDRMERRAERIRRNCEELRSMMLLVGKAVARDQLVRSVAVIDPAAVPLCLYGPGGDFRSTRL